MNDNKVRRLRFDNAGLPLEELDVERELMAKVVKLKLQYFGHVARGSAGQL